MFLRLLFHKHLLDPLISIFNIFTLLPIGLMNNNSLNYNTQLRRLGLGIAFADELSRKELIHPVRVESEQTVPHRSPLPMGSYTFEQSGRQVPEGLLRHGSGRYSLSYFPGIKEEIDLRIFDYARNVSA